MAARLWVIVFNSLKLIIYLKSELLPDILSQIMDQNIDNFVGHQSWKKKLFGTFLVIFFTEIFPGPLSEEYSTVIF